MLPQRIEATQAFLREPHTFIRVRVHILARLLVHISRMGSLTQFRRQIIETVAKAGEGHIPSALSILDIIWVLYDDIMLWNASDPKAEYRDRFLLSKGHGCLALYVILADKGFFPVEWLDRFCKPGAELDGHPDSRKIPGVEITSGSLGHGLPIAVGMAMALRLKNNPARVYCLIGDQEAQEGTTWEAAALAAHHRLSNLFCIVDYNGFGRNAVDMESMANKFDAFRWATSAITGGNHANLAATLSMPDHAFPTCVVAHTVKGQGCPAMEAEPAAWHHRAPTAEELPRLLESVK
jgi:transketolase